MIQKLKHRHTNSKHLPIASKVAPFACSSSVRLPTKTSSYEFKTFVHRWFSLVRFSHKALICFLFCLSFSNPLSFSLGLPLERDSGFLVRNQFVSSFKCPTTPMKVDDPSSLSCDGCDSRELAFMLLNVQFGDETQRHCANCLLNNHPGLFCPMCFEVYQESPPPHLRLLCLRCPAIAHRSCAISAANSEAFSPAFLCPTCADPSFAYMRLRNGTNNQKDRRDGAVSNGGSEGVGGEPVAAQRQNGENTIFIDVAMCKVLVAAAQIAAVKISRAAMEAKERAAELATIAAKARKEAREQLQCVSDLHAREKNSRVVLTDHNSRIIMDGIIGASAANDGSQSWNHMETRRSNLIRKDGVLPAVPSRNDVSVAGIGSESQSNHINGESRDDYD